MDWPIVQGIGIGPLHYGMSPADVSVLLGSPSNVRVLADRLISPAMKELVHDEVVEYRRLNDDEVAAPSLTYKAGELVEMEFYPEQSELRLGDLRLFSLPRLDLVREILTIDPASIANEYTFYSPKLLLAMAMPIDADEHESIAISMPGRDPFLPDDMRPAVWIFGEQN